MNEKVIKIGQATKFPKTIYSLLSIDQQNRRVITYKFMLQQSVQRRFSVYSLQGWQVLEEIHCIAKGGSTRRLDILAYNALTKKGFVIDPTIRFEISINEAQDVSNEKQNIYEPYVDYLKELYKLDAISVIGLMIGAGGTITQFYEKFRKQFGLDSK